MTAIPGCWCTRTPFRPHPHQFTNTIGGWCPMTPTPPPASDASPIDEHLPLDRLLTTSIPTADNALAVVAHPEYVANPRELALALEVRKLRARCAAWEMAALAGMLARGLDTETAGRVGDRIRALSKEAGRRP